MIVNEQGDVFQCDCGFSWRRGHSGSHNCAESLRSQCDDLIAVNQDHQRLVRELDVILNGEGGAAEQASLCDIVAQLKAKAGAA